MKRPASASWARESGSGGGGEEAWGRRDIVARGESIADGECGGSEPPTLLLGAADAAEGDKQRRIFAARHACVLSFGGSSRVVWGSPGKFWEGAADLRVQLKI